MSQYRGIFILVCDTYIDSCLSCDVCIITYIPSNKSSAIHILMCIPVGAKVCNIIDLNNYCFVGYYSVF